MKTLVLVVLIALVGWLAWISLPGLRATVGRTLEERGGWTEEARRRDPVGFLEFAEEKLRADLETFRESGAALERTRAEAEAERARNETLRHAADVLAERFRAAWREAREAGAWPVVVEGASYDEEQLVEQVEALLGERDAYARAVATYAEVTEAAAAQHEELRERLRTTEATLVELAAKRELARVRKATEETEALLDQVDRLLETNDEARDALAGPVRGVEELLRTVEADPDRASEERARAFLAE